MKGNTFFRVGFFLIISTKALVAAPMDSWTEFPLPTGASAPVSVAFGKGRFVAVGANGAIITSTNGSDWIKVLPPPGGTGNITRVRFLNDRFVTIGPSGLSSPTGVNMYSLNGIDWTIIPNPTNPAWDIAFLNGTYYAVGWVTDIGTSGVATSSDLTTWSFSPAREFHTIAGGNGVLVSGESPYNQGFYYSGAGGWTKIANITSFSGASGPASEITFQNGLFMTICAGQNWSYPPAPIPSSHSQVLSFSADGIIWSNAFAVDQRVETVYSRRAAAGGGYYVFPAGTSLYYAQNLTPITEGSGDWTKVNLDIPAPDGTSSDVAFGNDLFVAVTLGKIFRSSQLSGVDPIHIATQPASVTVLAGGTARLTVIAQGSDPIIYQWRREGTNLIGETQNALTLSNITVSAAGHYDVEITNPAGTVISDSALVAVSFAQMLLYAGVTLNGNVGDKFLVEYQDALNPSAPWNNLATVTLSSPKYVYIDYDSPSVTSRTYRATFLP